MMRRILIALAFVFLVHGLAGAQTTTTQGTQNILKSEDHLNVIALERRANAIVVNITMTGENTPALSQELGDCLLHLLNISWGYQRDTQGAMHLLELSHQMESKSDEKIVNDRLRANLLDLWLPAITSYRFTLTDHMPSCRKYSYVAGKEKEIIDVLEDGENILRGIIERIGRS